MKRTTLIVSSLAAIAAALPLAAAQAYETGSHNYSGTSNYNSNKRAGSPKPTVTYQAPRPANVEPVWNGHKPINPYLAAARRHNDDGDDRHGYRRGHDDDRGWNNGRWSDDDDRPWQHRRHKRWWWRAWR